MTGLIIIIVTSILFATGEVLKTPANKSEMELLEEEWGEKDEKEEAENEVEKTWVYYLGVAFEVIATFVMIGWICFQIYEFFSS